MTFFEDARRWQKVYEWKYKFNIDKFDSHILVLKQLICPTEREIYKRIM